MVAPAADPFVDFSAAIARYCPLQNLPVLTEQIMRAAYRDYNAGQFTTPSRYYEVIPDQARRRKTFKIKVSAGTPTTFVGLLHKPTIWFRWTLSPVPPSTPRSWEQSATIHSGRRW